MGQRWLTMPSSMMETKWKTDPKAKAPSATRNRCSRRRTNVRMACRRPSEYSPAATRSQMTLISAMGRCDTLSLSYQYIAGLRKGRSCPGATEARPHAAPVGVGAGEVWGKIRLEMLDLFLDR